MKRLIIYGVLIYLVIIAPVKRADVGKLEPVEVVYLSEQDERVVLNTDTGGTGHGKNVHEALEDLKETTAGVVYLDTAEFLLLKENATKYIDDLRDILKKSVKVCFVEGEIDLKKAAKYLSIHKNLPLLRLWNTEEKLPFLMDEKIIEKSQKSS